jgi:hypothetical protein
VGASVTKRAPSAPRSMSLGIVIIGWLTKSVPAPPVGGMRYTPGIVGPVGSTFASATYADPSAPIAMPSANPDIATGMGTLPKSVVVPSGVTRTIRPSNASVTYALPSWSATLSGSS